jgi:hypothetical protein
VDRLNELLPVGPPIDEDQQIGRTSAIDALEERLRACHVVKLLEPRRVGKTSVARASLARIKASGGTVAEVNLATRAGPESTAADLARQLAGGLVRARTRLGGLLSGLRRADDGEVIGEQAELVLRVVEELCLMRRMS